MTDRRTLLTWLAGVAVLVLAAVLRGAEYDEQYTLFLTGQQPRPDWPDMPFPPALAAAARAAPASLRGLLEALRTTDVHPPLYFVLEAGWRAVAGDGLVMARVPSVVASAAGLALVARLAGTAGAPAWLAMALTAGSFGFVATGVVARGFALAQVLNLAGAAILLTSRVTMPRLLLAGALFGAASCANYLAVFAAAGLVLGWLVAIRPPVRAAMTLAAGAMPFILVDLVFFLAQRNSRTGQFPPFELLPALLRLGRCAAGALLGGLPLYVPDGARRLLLAAGLATLAAAVVGLALAGAVRRGGLALALAAAAAGSPLGLLALGLAFDNSPIEMRYLAFALPWLAILIAARPVAAAVTLAVQASAIAGLLWHPATMQPARAAAGGALALPSGALVLVPRGNDGVGIVGALALEIRGDVVLAAVGREPHPLPLDGHACIGVATLAQDDASRDAVAWLDPALTRWGWEAAAAKGPLVIRCRAP